MIVKLVSTQKLLSIPRLLILQEKNKKSFRSLVNSLCIRIILPTYRPSKHSLESIQSDVENLDLAFFLLEIGMK